MQADDRAKNEAESLIEASRELIAELEALLHGKARPRPSDDSGSRNVTDMESRPKK